MILGPVYFNSYWKVPLYLDTFIPNDPTPLPNLNLGTDDVSGPGIITANNADAAVDVDVCCKRFIPGTQF